ncbi:MAG: alpha-amylase family glycosyl hydrolase, partial [Promicromonosporaceae bacterium]|nr:alpha-amylase family glycosyl hydrolase [Promicromonosporaceae bacterium]
MSESSRFRKFLLAPTLAFAMLFPVGCSPAETSIVVDTQNVAGQSEATIEETVVEAIPLAENIADGVILHAWSWSFATIEANLEDIAAAGYSAIQTSPIQEAYVGDGGGMQIGDTATSVNHGQWYYLYQPISWDIGNYQLGTEAEFVSLTTAAHELGLKIIVDVVVNHMTSMEDSISPSVADIPDVFHDECTVYRWQSRENVTQCYLLGLVDLRTGNPLVQAGLSDMLLQMIDDGADGFRF